MHDDFRYHHSVNVWPDTGEEFPVRHMPARWKSDWERMYDEAFLENVCYDIRKRSEQEKHRRAARNAHAQAMDLQRLFGGK